MRLRLEPVVDVWSDCSKLSRSVSHITKRKVYKYYRLWMSGPIVLNFQGASLNITKRKVYKYYWLWMSGPIVLNFQGPSQHLQEKSLHILPVVDV